jgi:hypothetical protein
MINAACTSPVDSQIGAFGARGGEKLDRPGWAVREPDHVADHVAAINVPHPVGGPDITPARPVHRARQMVRNGPIVIGSVLPIQDSDPHRVESEIIYTTAQYRAMTRKQGTA